VGVRGWVGVRLDARPSWKQVEKVVREAHAFIAGRSPRRSPLPRRGRGQGEGEATTRPPSGTATPPGRRR
jgi:hypothetical protein